MDIQGQAENKLSLPQPFCSIWALSGLDDAHTLVREIFIQSTDPDANLFWDHSYLTDTLSNGLIRYLRIP